jgi:hypothetical protein
MGFVLSFLVFECIFFGVGSCAKFFVLSQLIIIFVSFYPCLQLVYVELVISNKIRLLIGVLAWNVAKDHPSKYFEYLIKRVA